MKKQTSRFLAAFLTLLMLFSPLSVAVSALSVGETVKVSGASEWIPGFYYNFSKSGFGTNKHGQHQRLHTADGRPAYCVEPNKHFTDGNKTIRETIDSLPENVQDNISFAFLYGFDGNTKYGYSWQTEYVATQGVIWALVQGYFNTVQEDTFLNCAFGGSTSSANRANCKAVYSKIKGQILSHKILPSFAGEFPSWGSKITLKYNFSTGKYEGSVTDGNGVLSGYSFSCSGVSFTKSGNTLYISTDRILDNATVSGERTSNSYVSTLPAICAGYAVGSNQTTAVALDLKDPVNAYFRLETESVGHVKLVKTSEDGKVENVSLHISGNGIEKDVKTGKDGTITVKNLIAGTYTVSEITNVYYVPQTAQTFTILPGQTTTVTFNNVLKRGSLTVTKTSEDGVLEGHRFHLFGTSESGLEVNAYAVTDNTGKAYFNDILIGNAPAKKQSINCYKLFSKFAKADKAIPTSIVACGDDIWNGAGDRGDSSMFLYGLCRYLLSTGDKKKAIGFLPAIETAQKYVQSQITDDGIVKSDSDELENRFKSGKANLSTACITYDAFVSLHYLYSELGYDEKSENVLKNAQMIKEGIENYFVADVEGYQTYRYCKEESNLRSWICLPLVMGIDERKSATVSALLSDKLCRDNGMLTRSGEKTYWDRSLLYALRGLFYVGETEKAFDLLSKYTNERLLGFHPPYPIEAFPEGNSAQLSAESALYLRIFTEGILGYRPTGFNKFEIKPNLPDSWNSFIVKNIELCGKHFNIFINNGDKYTVKINDKEIKINKMDKYIFIC